MATGQTIKPRGLHAFINLSRLEALGDAVFAFALTLLALDLRLPATETSGLADGLIALAPRLLIFLMAFLTIGNQWDVHQRTMLRVARADGLFVWLNLLALMFVTLLPASADILGRYPVQPLALACFGGNMALLGFASWLMWVHAAQGGHLLVEGTDPELVRLISRLWLMSPIVFALTIPIAYLSVYPVYLLWVLLPVVSYLSIARRLRQYGTEIEQDTP